MLIFTVLKLLYLNQKHTNTYKILDHYGVRIPLLPLDFGLHFSNKEILTPEYFKHLLKNPILREGIYLASPELYKQILKWEKGFLKDPKKIERLQFSILKYATRITTRCTPFGLFASCSSGSFGENTRVSLEDQSNYKRFTRFDTTFLTQLYQVLLEEPLIKSELLFYPNSSLYKINDHYRYVEYGIENKRRTYSLEGIHTTEALELVLQHVATGKKIKELAALLVDEDVNLQDATEYVEQLIDHQLLVSELEITVTGPDYFTNLISRIKKIPESKIIYNKLLKLQKALNSLDHKIGNSIAYYDTPIELAKELVPDLDTKYLFQTDCFSTSHHNHLSKNIKKQLYKAFILFNKLTEHLPKKTW